MGVGNVLGKPKGTAADTLIIGASRADNVIGIRLHTVAWQSSFLKANYQWLVRGQGLLNESSTAQDPHAYGSTFMRDSCLTV